MRRLSLDSAITIEQLRKRTSEKWRTYPDAVLPMFVAESDFPIAEPIARRLQCLIANGDLGYATAKGLGEAYAGFAAANYGIDVDPADVRAIPELMAGVAEILRVLTRTGDAVIVNSPVYPPFFSTIREVGCVAADAPLRRAGRDFALDFEACEAQLRAGARVLLLCNPHNPVGRVYSRDDLARLAMIARRHDAVILSDEIHAPLVLPGVEFTPFAAVAAETGTTTITLTSASKGWNLGGLKCAIAIASGQTARDILDRLPHALLDRTGHLAVHATIAAFREGVSYLCDVRDHLDRIRAQLRSMLDEAGLNAIDFTPPEAGYLAWFDCTGLGLDDPAGAFLKAGVAVFPGAAFGPGYEKWIRFNFATSTAIVAEAMQRMSNAVRLT